jgi:hypothetical protein
VNKRKRPVAKYRKVQDSDSEDYLYDEESEPEVIKIHGTSTRKRGATPVDITPVKKVVKKQESEEEYEPSKIKSPLNA